MNHFPDWALDLLGDYPVVWPLATAYLLLTWFQPILLQLNLVRGLAWIALWVFVPALILIALPIGFNPVISFLQAALPGLAFIRWRSRPWMTLPASALYTVGIWLLAWPRFGNFHLIVAMTTYGAVLLFGTRLLPAAREQQSEGGVS